MAAALQIWSVTFTRSFDNLPAKARAQIERHVDEMGSRLASFAHKRLTGRKEFKLRVGNYRVLYEFDAEAGRIYLHYVGDRKEIYKSS
ncbi:MAG: type II toxin-antitoxin system RelE/ParE family toxin [Verrucomicrobiota bacterium]|nr:type II toxin-antitoxin system RelE/ParE family toxin [Verrucomicrobiota bacterium]MDQ6940172.1 type II toxin-antitoxin system RelE/ParE family toxin [Verrucomicrobiota bacterium]